MAEEERPHADHPRTDEAALAGILEEVISSYSTVLRRALAQVDGDSRLTLTQFRCLQALAVTGSALTTQLARQMEVAVPTMTGRIDSLVAHRFVERHPDPADRRQIQLVLTEVGREHFERCQQAISTTLQRLMAQLNPDQQTRLAGALQDLELLLATGTRA
ncbi:MAG TPA: MarR family transcriptional regulator [Chloroflexota bacterium]|nr:MarR family transcriptional regulator [Chloroflexota bacterium]